MINKLINLANTLDESGFKKEADRVDLLIKKATPMALPFVIPILTKALVAAGIATAIISILVIVTSEAYHYLKELNKQGPLERGSVKDAVDRGFDSPKYKEALKLKPDLGPGWQPPGEVKRIIVEGLAIAFGVRYFLKDEDLILDFDAANDIGSIQETPPKEKKRKKGDKKYLAVLCEFRGYDIDPEAHAGYYFFGEPGFTRFVGSITVSRRSDAIRENYALRHGPALTSQGICDAIGHDVGDKVYEVINITNLDNRSNIRQYKPFGDIGIGGGPLDMIISQIANMETVPLDVAWIAQSPKVHVGTCPAPMYGLSHKPDHVTPGKRPWPPLKD